MLAQKTLTSDTRVHMDNRFEVSGEFPERLPKHEARWMVDRINGIKSTFEKRDQFPDALFDGRPYDEQTVHLRFLQLHRESIRLGHSEVTRQTLLDIAIGYGIAAELPEDVIQENWAKAEAES